MSVSSGQREREREREREIVKASVNHLFNRFVFEHGEISYAISAMISGSGLEMDDTVTRYSNRPNTDCRSVPPFIFIGLGGQPINLRHRRVRK